MNHNINTPDARELIIAKGNYKGQPFACIGIIREAGDKRLFVSMFGEKLPWYSVSKWEYLHDVAPLYDVWSPDGTLFYLNPNMTGPKHESAEVSQA